ncbi:hypothetical protein MAR_017095 [Mya arenaria]|uniref:YqaJ viral recombinase domain-containing protein n=1 Tax=Mya arenaria TaxID=6604 RepID=A0ABY7EEB3_MYAAR|nr:hypothetical protein MAR_017095 [Mya arenaria]
MDGLKVSQAQAEEIEQMTWKQSDCPEWHKLRHKRLKSSTFKDILIRKKDFGSLPDRLTSIEKSKERPSSKALKMKAMMYWNTAHIKISSPDRIVYHPNEIITFSVLEVKCPMKDSNKDAQFLKHKSNGTYYLKKSHAYYPQVLGQMAIRWHRSLNMKTGAAPPFYVLLQILHREAKDVEEQIHLVSELSLRRIQRKSTRSMQWRLFSAWDAYTASDISISGLLKKVSVIYGHRVLRTEEVEDDD